MRFPASLAVILVFFAASRMAGAEGVEVTVDDPFAGMLQKIYAGDPRIDAERSKLKEADEKVSQANAGFRPSLAANLSAGEQREKIGSGGWNSGSATAGSLVATQPLFSGYGTVEQKRAAEARVMAARARLLLVEQEVFFAAISSWLDVCEKERVLELTRQNLESMKQYGSASEERFKAGDGTRTDVAQAESRMAQAEARYAVALADRESARASFERDTGMIASSCELPALPAGIPASRDEATQTARNNPELLQAEQEEKAAAHDVRAAKSSLWPNIYLRGSMSEERAPSLGLSTLRNDSITLNASIPLYQGGAEYSRVREARLARERSRLRSEDTSREATERAAIAWNGYASATLVIDASKRAMDAAQTALGGVEEEQRQGLRTLTEVLNERLELLSAQITHTQAQKNLRLEAYRLLAATGRLNGQGLKLVGTYRPEDYHDAVAGRWAGMSITH